jgi:putative FmdB family regulatory protein
MPEYSFICQECKHTFSKFFSFSEYEKKIKLVSCKKCESKLVGRDFQSDNVVTSYVKGLHEVSTIGEYADKQAKKFGKQKCEEMAREFKTKKDPDSGMKELPSGMTRAKSYAETPKVKRKPKKK